MAEIDPVVRREEYLSPQGCGAGTENACFALAITSQGAICALAAGDSALVSFAGIKLGWRLNIDSEDDTPWCPKGVIPGSKAAAYDAESADQRNFSYHTDRFPTTDVQATEVITWRSAYSRLLEALGSAGTEVVRSRVLETDEGIAPGAFVRNGFHEYVFPPQETELQEDTSGVIDSTPGNSLRREAFVRTFDESQVTGRLRVTYDDADSRISFRVTDTLGESVLPDEVIESLGVLSTTAATSAAARI